MRLEVVKHRKLFLWPALGLVVLSLAAVGFFGFRQGIDFTGGSLWQLKFKEQLTENQVREALLAEKVEGVSISRGGDGSWLIRFSAVSEEKHQELVRGLERELGEFTELSFQSIGPAIGRELRRGAIWAVALVLLGISSFVALAFRRVTGPISAWVYGGVTLATLFHDVAIPTGLLAVWSRVGGMELDTNFIVALLVIAGFSVHDTIVVFDRIRENLIRTQGREPLAAVVDISVEETLARSINTSVTLMFVLLALLLAGPVTLYYFVLTILIGTTVGTYSSVFVASPLLVMWQEYKKK